METLRSRTFLILALALFAVTAATFSGVAGHEFLNFDDDDYVTRNPAVQGGLTAEGVRWAFTTSHAGNWHPLTWLSHMLDVELFGADASGHHLTSACLHAVNAVLLLAALVLLTGELLPAALATALFALHPLRAESVAWVSERKDVLAGTFAFLTLIAYAGYARRPGAGRMALVAIFLGLGLLAKQMLVTLPFVLLLLDRWPLARTESPARLVLEKLPLFVLVVASSVVVFLVQRGAGAVGPLEELGLGPRLANGLAAYGGYLRTTLWPAGLVCFYPHPSLAGAEPGAVVFGTTAVLSAAVLAAVSGLAFAWKRRHPYLLTGWLWFLGMLVPVLGLVQIGAQARADRYTYLPSIGLAVAAAWLAAAAARRIGTSWVAGSAAAVLIALAAATRAQVATWRDSITLFEHALEHTERNYRAHTNLGQALDAAGRLPEAREQYEEALEILPGQPAVHMNLGITLRKEGRVQAALDQLATAVRLDPEFALARVNLGSVLQQVGRDAEAVAELRRALELEPERVDATVTLAWVLATSRDAGVRSGEEAVALARAACAATGDAPASLETLAAAYAETGRFAEAVRAQERAIDRVPPPARGPLQARLEGYRAGRPHRKSP